MLPGLSRLDHRAHRRRSSHCEQAYPTLAWRRRAQRRLRCSAITAYFGSSWPPVSASALDQGKPQRRSCPTDFSIWEGRQAQTCCFYTTPDTPETSPPSAHCRGHKRLVAGDESPTFKRVVGAKPPRFNAIAIVGAALVIAIASGEMTCVATLCAKHAQAALQKIKAADSLGHVFRYCSSKIRVAIVV